VSLTPSTRIIDPANVVDYLRGRQLIVDNPSRVEELTGGVSSIVITVDSPGRHLVVKQSLPLLRVEAEWRAKPERIITEATGLELASALTPGRVPSVLDVDERAYVIVIERAPPGWTSWKQQLFDGSATGADEALRRPFIDIETFIQLRVEPYYMTVADCHKNLAVPIKELMETMDRRRLCFVHGDFSPKNVLAGKAGLWVLDFEVAHVGDPVFDVAFMLHHLTLKAIHTGALDRIVRLAEAFRGGYLDADGGTAFDDLGYLASHIGCLLIARVDGKSPAEYLTSAERDVARLEGSRLLFGRPGKYERLWRG
jgi:5-methylthioribose kinase